MGRFRTRNFRPEVLSDVIYGAVIDFSVMTVGAYRPNNLQLKSSPGKYGTCCILRNVRSYGTVIPHSLIELIILNSVKKVCSMNSDLSEHFHNTDARMVFASGRCNVVADTFFGPATLELWQLKILKMIKC